MAKFRKVDLKISRGKGYGQYFVTAKYKGKYIYAHTTNSECFDYLDNEENKKKHLEAKRYAYRLVVKEYNKIYN